MVCRGLGYVLELIVLEYPVPGSSFTADMTGVLIFRCKWQESKWVVKMSELLAYHGPPH